MNNKKFTSGFVSIIGRPNVGKSSLMNLLLHHERSIVSDVAGTTREAISETTYFCNDLILFAANENGKMLCHGCWPTMQRSPTYRAPMHSADHSFHHLSEFSNALDKNLSRSSTSTSLMVDLIGEAWLETQGSL